MVYRENRKLLNLKRWSIMAILSISLFAALTAIIFATIYLKIPPCLSFAGKTLGD